MKEKTNILIAEPLQKSNIRLEEFKNIFNFLTPFMDFPNRLWKFFTSIKLSVVLLLLLAATSIIGTLIPQNKSPEQYLSAFGEPLYRIFDVFNILDMYHSWWFNLLIILLASNIIVCSINRLSATWKIVFVKIPPFNISRFKKLSNKEEFFDQRTPENLKKIYEPFISKRFGYTRVDQTDKGLRIFAEKWRWTRLGVYTVHLSVLLLLVGALVGSIFGFDGYINIPEGETVSSIRLRNTGQLQNLDFTVRCDDFNVSFYDSGPPKEFRSKLSVFEAGKPVLQKDIIVNDPLRYKGINFFQSSYGPLPPREVTLSFQSVETGKIYRQNTIIGQEIKLPEGMGKFVVKEYRNPVDFRGQNVGEAFLGTLTPKDGNPVFVLLPSQFPSFDRMRKGSVVISVAGYNQRYYTGLQVTNDPGVWVVYAGFIMIVVGCFITFFMSHQRLCIDVIKKGGKSKVMIAGTANKNKLGMDKKIKILAQKLVEL
jgi:cytochrome c biogenesis protein